MTALQVKAKLGETSNALTTIETVRQEIEQQLQNISRKDLRRSYLGLQQDSVELYIGLLNRVGRPAKALQVSEAFRARTLQEKLHNAGGRKLTTRQKQRRVSLLHKLNNFSVEYHQLTDKLQRDQILSEVQDLAAQIEELEVEIENNNKILAITKPAAIFAPATFQSQLGTDTLALVFFTGKEKSWLWLLAHDRLEMLELPVITQLEQQVAELLGMVNTKPGERTKKRWQQQQAMQKLGATLLGHNSINLASYSNLLIIPDGPLNYLPFATLPLPGTDATLLDKFSLIYAPSLSIQQKLTQQFASTDKSTKPGKLLVIADPVIASSTLAQAMADNTVKQTTDATAYLQAAKQLPYARQEARAISKIAVGDTTILQGIEASKHNLLAQPLQNYSIVHFATHALADRREQAMSGLVLSSNGNTTNNLLLIPEITQLQLPVELVVLSGCETAIGENLQGEGLMGLSRAFFEAGAKRVVASLWPVQDKATAQLMSHFYQALLIDKQSPAVALQQAQQQIASQRRWRDPYYWAGFVLQGVEESWFE